MARKSRSGKVSLRLMALLVSVIPSPCIVIAAAGAQEMMSVSVVVAREGLLTDQISIVGTLVPREKVEVHPLVSGPPITRILAETGQYVEEGQALAMLDTTDAQMLLDKNAVGTLRAEAAVAVARSRVDVALVAEAESRRRLERSRALQPKGAVSLQLLDEHQNAHARAVAELALERQSLALAEAEADLVIHERREIELRIERGTLKAPTAGVILDRRARLGALASDAGDALFSIAENGLVEVVAQVVETDFVRLRDGMHAEINLPGRSDPATGTLRMKAAQMDPVTRSGEVRIRLDENDRVTPGIFARGHIKIAERRGILLPGTAVRSRSGEDMVYVVANGVVDVRPVTVGLRRDGFVEITGGLSAGEMVALKAGGFLKDREKVHPVIAGADAAPKDELAVSPPTDDARGRMRE
ncbi:efflux RND transporter periplasmic adaptor subunit (plasmid) [Tistrella mobilis]|uniref:efflux RND transporter periplasmic adaptor subunit n=1 Tax=Tistrella mobilis TaxID=171437 RepID=UPI0035589329